MISVSFYHVFIVNNGEKCPRGEVLARFYRPGGGVSPNKNLPGGFALGGGGRDDQAWN